MRLVPAVSVLFPALVLFVSSIPVSATPACAQSALRLNEICAAPARDWNGDGVFSSRDDEWVEVVNTGGAPVVLDAFVLMDGDSIPRFALTGTLAPGEVRVVYGKESYDWERASGRPAFGLSLGNTGDRVTLWEVAGADTSFVDGWTYGSHQSASDRSVGRTPDGSAWVLFDGLNPYAGSLQPSGTGCVPTPGVVNTCFSTPARPATWGEVKRRWR